MFTTTIQQLKNTVTVAKHTGQMESFNASLKNDKRDISIVVRYYPEKNVKEDIYPRWEVIMKEEEETATVHISDNDKGKKEVRDIFNGFCAQVENETSFLTDYIPY